ncbi:hypothetical protein GGP41_006926 [Bipolaris sorokiniana]|uniref:Uncharacterized protein n=1 Tax=Cochliobolus sativus TaxID=45130 RepID=A0A8H5ZNW3_COCSA|nr:hypothetical protein GGP41_006926 [Bipolaris sorokiniana]
MGGYILSRVLLEYNNTIYNTRESIDIIIKNRKRSARLTLLGLVIYLRSYTYLGLENPFRETVILKRIRSDAKIFDRT